jgi:hypothetical protein
LSSTYGAYAIAGSKIYSVNQQGQTSLIGESSDGAAFTQISAVSSEFGAAYAIAGSHLYEIFNGGVSVALSSSDRSKFTSLSAWTGQSGTLSLYGAYAVAGGKAYSLSSQ